jgi:hypothetical protein
VTDYNNNDSKKELRGNVTAQIFWLKTRARWKETPSEHHHVAAVGMVDLSELADAELEKFIFGKPVELPGMSATERNATLRPVLQAVVDCAARNQDVADG